MILQPGFIGHFLSQLIFLRQQKRLVTRDKSGPSAVLALLNSQTILTASFYFIIY
jgi:hypothetical protein